MSSTDAPIDECIFGDDVVVNLQVIGEPLPQTQMSCEDVFTYLSSIDQFPIAYCSTPLFKKHVAELVKVSKFTVAKNK